MNLLCWMGKHQWKGCKCGSCNKNRGKNHTLTNGVCDLCGQTLSEQQYLTACFESGLSETTEPRNTDQRFAQTIAHVDSSALIRSYPDFWVGYDRLADESGDVWPLYAGLERARTKYCLANSLALRYAKLDRAEDAVMWWIRSLMLQSAVGGTPSAVSPTYLCCVATQLDISDTVSFLKTLTQGMQLDSRTEGVVNKMLHDCHAQSPDGFLAVRAAIQALPTRLRTRS